MLPVTSRKRIAVVIPKYGLLFSFDTFGMSVLEAMAAGVPVIVSDRVGAKDLVAHGRNGFVVDRDAIVAVANCLELLMLPEKWAAFSAGGVHVAWEYTWEKAAERYTSLYSNFLSLELP